MSDFLPTASGTNPDVPNPASTGLPSLNLLLSIETQTRQLTDIDSRLKRLEIKQRPIESFFKSNATVSKILSFSLVITPILQIICTVVAFVVLNPSATFSGLVNTLFGLLGLGALVEMLLVPVWINTLRDRLDKLEGKNA